VDKGECEGKPDLEVLKSGFGINSFSSDWVQTLIFPWLKERDFVEIS
jgi:hypothetical protein